MCQLQKYARTSSSNRQEHKINKKTIDRININSFTDARIRCKIETLSIIMSEPCILPTINKKINFKISAKMFDVIPTWIWFEIFSENVRESTYDIDYWESRAFGRIL